MTVPGPELSIVIVSYKVRERLRACLESLRQVESDGPTFEVVVVDNASGDGTCEILPEAFPEVVFLPMDRNLGFSIACNRGAQHSSGRRILFLNPDTVVFPDTLKTVCAFLDEHPKAGIVGCRILDGEGRLQLACRRSIPTLGVALSRLSGLSFLFPKSRRFGKYNLTYLDPAESTEVEAVSGSFLLITREACDEVGGFDEDYFLYAEDLDLCLRVARTGREVWYCGKTSIVHHKGQSAATRPWGARMDFYRAMVIFARKNLGVGPLFEVVLNVVAALLATGNVLANQVSQWRRLVSDLLMTNLVFMLVAVTWMGIKGIGGYLGTPMGWSWHLVLTLCIFVGQGVIGAYRQGGTETRSRLVALVISLGVFLGIGLVFKQYVFSRAVFVLGGGLAAASLLVLTAMPRKSAGPPLRVVVAGTGPVSQRLAQLLHNQSRVRVVGLLGMMESTARTGDFLVVARMPHIGPVIKALDLNAIVVPGEDPDVARILVQLVGVRRSGLKLLLALVPAGTELPALVDITLDKSLIPERSA